MIEETYFFIIDIVLIIFLSLSLSFSINSYKIFSVLYPSTMLFSTKAEKNIFSLRKLGLS